MKKLGKIIVIAGPTGSGESAITRAVLKKLKGTERIITATTRQPRPYENNGVDYFFLSLERFMEMVNHGDFLEYVKVPNRDVYYGTIKEQIEQKLAAGTNLIGNFEKHGVLSFRKAFPGRVLGIFIKPDNLGIIKKRLIKRDPTISAEEVKKRLINARREMKEAEYYDHVVLNPDGKMDLAVRQVLGLVKKFLMISPC